MGREPVCFGCGSPTGPLPRLNRLPNGQVCPTCRDRLLDSLPAALPAPREPLAGADAEEPWAEEPTTEDYLEGA